MLLTPEERRAALGLLALLLAGQAAAFLLDERKARPDRELSAWLTRQQAARAESLGSTQEFAGTLAYPIPTRGVETRSVPRFGGSARREDPGAMATAGRSSPSEVSSSQLAESQFVGDSAESSFEPSAEGSPPGIWRADSAAPVRIEPASRIPRGVAGSGRVAINRASARDLEVLPGIGPSLAKRIVEERERTGPFRAPRDLLRVKGIGARKLAACQDRIDWSP